MSPTLHGVGEAEGGKTVSFFSSSASRESGRLKGPELKVRNYMGLSDSRYTYSEESSMVSIVSDGTNSKMNIKATELWLGLPGSQSPEREADLSLRSSGQIDEKPLFPLHPSIEEHHLPSPKTAVLGSKRGFFDAMNGSSEGKFLVQTEVDGILSPMPLPNLGLKSGSAVQNLQGQPIKLAEVTPTKALQERVHVGNETRVHQNGPANNSSSAPCSKAQVVGWPPVGSFRKNSLAASSENTKEVDAKAGANALFIKVSMDGAPYLRKVDLTSHSSYPDLSSALEKMFSCFTIGQCGSQGAFGIENMNESKLKDLLHGSEYVLTYEDKDGDWMLVGDVPWEMFTDTCRRMRIMKSSDAIGLAPRGSGEERVRTGTVHS